MSDITVQALIKDIAELNGLTDDQQTALFIAVEQCIDDWFRAQGL